MKFAFHTLLVTISVSLLSSGLLAQGSGQSGRPPQGPRMEQGPQGPQGDRFAEGEREMRRERFDRARMEFERDPNDPRGLYLLGEYFMRTGKVDSAAIAYKKGLAIDPEDWRCKIGLGRTLLESAPLEAAKVFDEVSKVRKLRGEVQIPVSIARAYLSVRTPDFGKVREWLGKAIAVNMKEPLIYLIEGDMNMKQQKVGNAVNSYKSALNYDPNNIDANFKLGRIYQQAREDSLALQFENKVLQLDSLHIPAYRAKGDLYFRRDQFDQASNFYRPAMRIGGGNVEDRARLAKSLFLAKRYEEALPELNRLLQVDPNNTEALRLKAYSLQIQGRNQEGVAYLEKFLSQASPDAIIGQDFECYSRLLMGLGEDSLAYIKLEKAISMTDLKRKKESLFVEMLDSINTRKQYEFADVYYKKFEHEMGTLLPSQYNTWGQDCYNAAVNRMNGMKEGTPQDSVLYKMYAQRADTLFAKVSELAPRSYLGLYWQANSKALLDPGYATMEAKPLYEKLLTFDNLIPSAKIAAYYYLGSCASLTGNLEVALGYYEKCLELDPNRADVLGYVETIKEALKPKK